ncbi:MAG: UMP kinase [Pseudomonadaceae bacterium]|nr:UMP kinase [Pseudomonadaceae bacterium]
MRRLLLKLSGEALAGEGDFGIDPRVLERLADEIRPALAKGIQLAIVLGGGNLFRGAALQAAGMDRVTGDHMGMMATVMNGLAFRDVLRSQGIGADVLSAFEIASVAEGYSRDRALLSLEQGRVVICVAGTGSPFFTTDSAACLRGIEIQADAVLKGTKVDGVYSADPVLEPNAERFESLSYDEVIARDLKVMDLTAICLCRDHDMPLVVFDMNEPGVLTRLIDGETVGTRINA